VFPRVLLRHVGVSIMEEVKKEPVEIKPQNKRGYLCRIPERINTDAYFVKKQVLDITMEHNYCVATVFEEKEVQSHALPTCSICGWWAKHRPKQQVRVHECARYLKVRTSVLESESDLQEGAEPAPCHICQWWAKNRPRKKVRRHECTQNPQGSVSSQRVVGNVCGDTDMPTMPPPCQLCIWYFLRKKKPRRHRCNGSLKSRALIMERMREEGVTFTNMDTPYDSVEVVNKSLITRLRTNLKERLNNNINVMKPKH